MGRAAAPAHAAPAGHGVPATAPAWPRWRRPARRAGSVARPVRPAPRCGRRRPRPSRSTCSGPCIGQQRLGLSGPRHASARSAVGSKRTSRWPGRGHAQHGQRQDQQPGVRCQVGIWLNPVLARRSHRTPTAPPSAVRAAMRPWPLASGVLRVQAGSQAARLGLLQRQGPQPAIPGHPEQTRGAACVQPRHRRGDRQLHQAHRQVGWGRGTGTARRRHQQPGGQARDHDAAARHGPHVGSVRPGRHTPRVPGGSWPA